MPLTGEKTQVRIILAGGKLKEVQVDAPEVSIERMTKMAVRVAQRLETSRKSQITKEAEGHV